VSEAGRSVSALGTVEARVRHALAGAKFPAMAVIVAFIVGGLVVAATGNNPFPVYKELAKGSGLDYLIQWIPGTNVNAELAKINLIATIVTTTPYILAGLCVAFAFRAGLFNIGGTGQFFAGAVAAFWVADALRELPGFLLIVVALLAAVAASALYGAIPGYLKAYRGAHEVISTIMLNWIAVYMGLYLFGLDGPLKGPTENPISVDIPERAQLPVLWGDVQGVHLGLFMALAAAVVFSLVVRRTTFGYEVRATGFNQDAARAGGINVKRTLILTMAVSGIFAGLAGAGEVLGVRYHLAANEFTVEQIGFIGIAVALLGRNTAIGCVLAAFLFGALRSGSQQLQGAFAADLAVPLADTVQGVIVLLVSGDLVFRWIAERRRKRQEAEAATPPAPEAPAPA
jgi:simple sugar transport system permease protein